MATVVKIILEFDGNQPIELTREQAVELRDILDSMIGGKYPALLREKEYVPYPYPVPTVPYVYPHWYVTWDGVTTRGTMTISSATQAID